MLCYIFPAFHAKTKTPKKHGRLTQKEDDEGRWVLQETEFLGSQSIFPVVMLVPSCVQLFDIPVVRCLLRCLLCLKISCFSFEVRMKNPQEVRSADLFEDKLRKNISVLWRTTSNNRRLHQSSLPLPIKTACEPVLFRVKRKESKKKSPIKKRKRYHM